MLALKLQEAENEAKIAKVLLDALVATRIWDILPATADDAPASAQVYTVAATVMSWMQSIKVPDVVKWGIEPQLLSIEVGFAQCLAQVVPLFLLCCILPHFC